MSREIDLKAELELEAGIITKVMGWKMEMGHTTPADYPYCFLYYKTYFIKVDHDGESEPFCPTREIADAWQVVEKLREHGVSIAVHIPCVGEDTTYLCEAFRLDKELNYHLKIGNGVAESAELAICYAALEAVKCLKTKVNG